MGSSVTTKEEVKRFLGSQICLKIVSNEILLGQISGIFCQIDGKYIVCGLLDTYFDVDLSRISIQDDYWMVDLGYNPSKVY